MSPEAEDAAAAPRGDGAADHLREVERLRALVDAYATSALLSAKRASAFDVNARAAQATVKALRRSTSWRMTLPLRLPRIAVTRGPAVGAKIALVLSKSLRERGLVPTARLVRARVAHRLWPHREARMARRETGASSFPAAAASVLAPRVLIIAELSLPQCAKYRVWQKQEHLTSLGVRCTVLDWRATEACRSAIQVHPTIIFYRIPGFADWLELIQEARRLGAVTFWECDDLIFDMDHYLANRNLDTLPRKLRREVLAGVDLFRRAMLACERTIASTEILADAMRAAGGGPSLVIENGLDRQTIELAARLRCAERPPSGSVVLVYGSGSKAHDADFAIAAGAVAELMRRRPHVILRIIGELKLPAALGPFIDRIERLPPTDFNRYLGQLSASDIALAPLEPTVFNDAKSNIKFLEASMVGLPSVCAANPNFARVIAQGETGFVARTEAEWLDALLLLTDDAALRRRIGAAALRTVTETHAPARIATTQVSALIADGDRRPRDRLRILIVNIYFAPISYGGATVIAEEMAARLRARPDAEVFVFTSRGEGGPQYTLRRHLQAGLTVIDIRPPHTPEVIGEFDNPEMEQVFADVLAAVEPDVVHFHAVQTLSASLLRACLTAGIPYVVTVHDAWWLCPRQFMVREDNGYCFQTRIDVRICAACLPGARHLPERLRLLHGLLAGAAAILSPSEAHLELYRANGFDPARLLVNRNGLRMPSRPPRRTGLPPVRFGFVGGASGLKGYHLIQAAFEAITHSNYELVLVDNTLKLGFSSIDASAWRVAGRLVTVPPFAQDELDTFFDGIHVLLFPSQWRESFGLIVAEALARDVWVIVTEGGGAAEHVIQGENGTIIPLVNDPAPLRQAVEALLRDPARLAGHVNPYKQLLRTYDAQAEELWGILRQASARGSAPGPHQGQWPLEP